MNNHREQPDLISSAPEYARRFEGNWGRYLLSVQNRLVADCLPANGAVSLLDVGGGHGQLLETYGDKGIMPTVFGSDEASFQQLDRDRIPCVAGDFLNLPFDDQTYDTVVSVRQLTHIENWRQSLAELCRVAKTDVVIDYPSLFSFNVLTPLLFKLKQGLEGDTREYSLFHNREIRDEFAQNGFRVASRNGQFFLPIVVHRLFKAATPLRGMEKLFRAIGLTDLAGSPMILHAVRGPKNVR